MSSPVPDVDLIPDGGLAALPRLRRVGEPDVGTGTRYRAVVLDPNEIRLQRMLSADRYLFGVQTPFVGRREILERLYNAVRDAVTDGKLRVVEVLGEPGSGKTRLLAEAFAIIDPVERGIDMIPLACSPSGDDDGGSLIAQLVRRRFGIAPSDRETVAREKLLEGIEPHVTARTLSATARALAFLAGIRAAGPSGEAAPGDLGQFRRSALRQFAALLRTDLSRAPHILVVHRAQHLTAGGRELLVALASELLESPLVLILVGREPVALEIEGVDALRIPVEPLEDRDIERQVRALLARVDDLPEQLVDDIVARSRGVPRLAEENVRLLIQRGALVPDEPRWHIVKGKLPKREELAASIQEASRERLRVLSDEARVVLSVASVFGYSFWPSGVASVLRSTGALPLSVGLPWVETPIEQRVADVLQALGRDGVVARQPESTLAGVADEYAFAHERDRNALYGELAAAERARVHRLAAQWLVRHGARDAGPWLEVVANHWEEGGRSADAAVALIDAARVARDGYAVARARQLLERALSLIDVDHAELLSRCLGELGEICHRTGDFATARAAFGAMLEATLVTGDQEAGARAWIDLGRANFALGDYGRARACLAHAERLYREANSSVGVAAAMDQLAKVVWLEGAPGGYDDALEHARRSLDVRRRLGEPRPIADSLGTLANIELQRGRFDEAKGLFEEALTLRQQAQDEAGEAACRVGLGAVHFALRDLDQAVQSWEDGLETAERVGDRELVGALLNNLGEVFRERGDLDRAAVALVEAREVTGETGDQRTAIDVARNLAALYAAQGELDAAMAGIDYAMTLGEALGSRPVMGQILRTRGEIMSLRAASSAPGSSTSEQATRSFDDAMACFSQLGDRFELDLTVASYAAHLERFGEVEQARRLRAHFDKG
ncbi:MAG: tetratricopeptide repeat protein [Myxococcales bacterium]|nr:tetratricopeptide repeat protein [Myxococcales bacterium]MCB9734935.1 tetratricopeptide repeat protein [Deltaproteobacteria bacterium]